MITNNFYFIDKPVKFTSFDIIKILRRKLDIRRMGHTGTLDPLASGGLLIATGNYTKLIPYIDKLKKEYEFEIMLDGVSDTFDLEKEVIYISKEDQEKAKQDITKQDIENILEKNFIGKVLQIPPKYSAIKIDGKKAYELAKKGKEVKLKEREIEIFEIKILDYSYPKLRLKALVSAGTYIRSIANDLGKILKTGGYISYLRRTKIGDLDISSSINLDDCKREDFIDIKKLFPEKFFINLEKDILEKLNNGIKIKQKFDFLEGQDLFVIDNNNITNIVIYDGEYLKPIKKI